MTAALGTEDKTVTSRPWWRSGRHIGNGGLVVLSVLSLVAAIVGWTVQGNIDRANAAIAPTSSSSPALGGTACRPGVQGTATQPWLDGKGAGEAVWQKHSAELAGPVVRGEHGWAFYNDQVEQNFSQTLGRKVLTVGEVKAWHDYFASIATGLKKQGIQLSIQIAPSAGTVAIDELPAWAQKLRGATPLDQLLAASPDLPLVDYRQTLRDAKDPVYTPVNSHWTDWGGYLAWKQFATCNAKLYPEAPAIDVPGVTGVRTTGVFNEYAAYGIPDAKPEWTAPEYASALPAVRVTDQSGTTKEVPGGSAVDLSALPASTMNDHAATTQKALILRDSTGNALSGLWDQQYAQTWQIQHRFDDWSSPPNFAALVAAHKPDVVIIVLAERHLVNAPKVTSGY